MPVHSAVFKPAFTLGEFGPILPVQILIPRPLEQLLARRRKPIPSPVSGVGLIDTGATKSAADISIMERLSLSQIGLAELGTASGTTSAPLFPARFIVTFEQVEMEFNFLPGEEAVSKLHQAIEREQFEIEFNSVVGLKLPRLMAGPLNLNLIALIGRDVLSRCIFIYNGTQGAYSLAT